MSKKSQSIIRSCVERAQGSRSKALHLLKQEITEDPSLVLDIAGAALDGVLMRALQRYAGDVVLKGTPSQTAPPNKQSREKVIATSSSRSSSASRQMTSQQRPTRQQLKPPLTGRGLDGLVAGLSEQFAQADTNSGRGKASKKHVDALHMMARATLDKRMRDK